MAVDPLSIKRELIEREADAPNLNVADAVSAGIQGSEEIRRVTERNKDIAKATEFEKLLEAGEEGMQLALKDAQAQGVDLTGIPDPKLYLRTKDDSANWYSILADKLETHQKKAASKEAFTSISQGTPEEAQAGIGKLVETGQVDALQGAQAARKIDFGRRLQSFISGEEKLVAPGGDGTEIKVDEFLASTDTAGAPPEIKTAADSAAKKVGMPADILLSVAKIESSFIVDNKPPFNKKTGKRLSTAVGLGQFINKTGEEILSLAKSKGLIEKNVKLDEARTDAEKSLIMVGLLFQKNLQEMGNVRDALLAHRLGVAGAREFIKTGKAMVEGRDETADVNKWITDAISLAFADGATGVFSDGSPNLDSVAGIDAEIQRILGNTEFSPTPPAKLAVAELQKKRALLSKGKDKGKDKGKMVATEQELKIAEGLEDILVLAENVKPSGRVKGAFRNILNFAFGVDANVGTLNAFSGLLSGQVAKGIGGESGRLTDQDREYALAALPKTNDTTEERRLKVKVLRVMIDRIRGAESGDVKSQDVMRREIYMTGFKNGNSISEAQLVEMWKEDQSDEAIKSFIWSNGKEVTPDKIARVRAKLEGSVTATPPAPKPPATTLQSGSDSVSQVQAPPADSFGGTLNIPGI